LSKFVSCFVFIRHTPILHMPLSTTGKRTKSRRVFAIILYLKFVAANLASQCHHICIIPRNIAYGTMGVAGIRQAAAQMILNI
jgi:hypothetical protein